jgi:hypothetical protein
MVSVAECFCGCGRKVSRFPLGTRSMNNCGRDVSARLAWGRDVLADGLDKTWADDGDEIVRLIGEVTHGSMNPRELDPSPISQWQAYGRQVEALAMRKGAPPIKVWLARVDAGEPLQRDVR